LSDRLNCSSDSSESRKWIGRADCSMFVAPDMCRVGRKTLLTNWPA